MADFLKKLQEKPYEVRLRILWATVMGAAVILVIIFVLNIKNTLKGVDGKDLIEINPVTESTTEISQTTFVTVERAERTERVLKIYFNFINPTDDILNISKLTDITLTFNDQQITPKSITDRQGEPFVQKILSHTQNFGILTFDPIDSGLATLNFDQMNLEKNPSSIFRQELELNLDELSKPVDLRN